MERIRLERALRGRGRRTAAVLGVLVLVGIAGAAGIVGRGASQAATPANWPGYLYSPGHSSYNPNATAITTANANSVKRVWMFKPDAPALSSLGGFYSSPTVVNGVVYIGGRNGYFYALNETNGSVIWKRFIGYVPAHGCGANGFTSTATVANDPTSGNPTVYVYGAPGYLYAMNTANGSDVWPPAVVAIPSPTKSDYYAWSSPLVYGGNIYVGISSGCDKPLVRAGIAKYSQTDGSAEGTYFTAPPKSVGASIWSSVATDGSSLYAATGNGNAGTNGYSIIKVAPATMTLSDIWTIPVAQRITDSDFGGSPTVFSATLSGTPTEMVGACNKNGSYYALRAGNLAAGPVWSAAVGDPSAGECDAAAVWDGQRLFVSGPGVSIGGTSYGGSVSEVNPATGAYIWRTGLSGAILGTPTEDGSGVIAAATYGSSNNLYLLNAQTGAILKTLPMPSEKVFAQPVFADGYVLLAGRSGGLKAFAAP